LWRHYFANTGGIVFCIDSADHCEFTPCSGLSDLNSRCVIDIATGRIDDVRDEIQHTLREELLQVVARAW